MSCASSVEIEDFPLNSAPAFALSKTYGMSCASSVEIEDVSHKAPCCLHVPNPYGTECVSYEKVKDFPLNSAPAFALSVDLRYVVCIFRRNRGFPA